MNSNQSVIILLVIIITAGIILFIILNQRIKRLQEAAAGQKGDLILQLVQSLRQDLNVTSTQNRQEIMQKIDRLLQQFNTNAVESTKIMQSQFRQSAEIIKDVTDRLRKIDDTNRQILDFSGQMKSLENILKNPKQRGILGEYFLEALLGNVLQPNQYKMQYRFPGGDMVDAAIFYRDRIIPVDAKFSLDTYNRIMETSDPKAREQLEKDFRSDIKERINETAKYIRPKEGTTEFAFMFIPAEGVYYNLLVYSAGSTVVKTRDLIEYAFQKHVIIVSPTSFFAYLETVLQGLKAQKVEENIKVIISRIHGLSRHLGEFENHFQKIGKNLAASVGSYNSAYKEFKKVDTDIYKIAEGEAGGMVEPLLLEVPDTDE